MYLPNVNKVVAGWVRRTGLTHADMAKLAGMSDSALRDKRMGRSRFTVDEIVAIARIAGVSAPMLLEEIRPGSPAKGENPIPRGTGKGKERP